MQNDMIKKIMKAIFSLLMLTITTGSIAQSGMSAVLTDDIIGYQANDEVRIDSLQDGTIQTSRTYSNGISSLNVRITKMSETQKEELPKQVQRLTDEFLKVAAEGRMEAEAKNSSDLKGVLTFFEGTAGGILIAKGAFLLEYQVSGVDGVAVSKKILENLNLSVL